MCIKRVPLVARLIVNPLVRVDRSRDESKRHDAELDRAKQHDKVTEDIRDKLESLIALRVADFHFKVVIKPAKRAA